MANSYLWTDVLADLLVGLIRDNLQGSLGLKTVSKVHGVGLKDFPTSEPLAEMLPAAFVVILGPKVLPGKVVGPVVDVEERFRIVYLTSADDATTPTSDLNAAIEALGALLMDHAYLEEGLLGEHTQQLKPLLMSAAEYDPPELAGWRKLCPALVGCAVPVAVFTTTVQ